MCVSGERKKRVLKGSVREERKKEILNGYVGEGRDDHFEK